MEVLTAVALTRRGRRRLGDVVTRHEDVDWSRRGERTARGKIRSEAVWTDAGVVVRVQHHPSCSSRRRYFTLEENLPRHSSTGNVVAVTSAAAGSVGNAGVESEGPADASVAYTYYRTRTQLTVMSIESCPF